MRLLLVSQLNTLRGAGFRNLALMGEGYSVIPSSTKRKNLESNLKAQNLQLDAEDKKAIAALDCNDRLVSPEGLAPEWD